VHGVTPARRIQAIRARRRIQRWEHRQRNLAHGAWGRFREALAMAAEAYAIDDAIYERLVAAGGRPDDRGGGLEPPRRLVWIPREHVTTFAARRIALRMDAELLAARVLALVPFDPTRG
jgi:hypothetical protein